MSSRLPKKRSGQLVAPMPERAAALLKSLNADGLTINAVENSYALYQADREYREDTPPPKAVLNHIDETDAAISKLRDCLEHMPDEISTWVGYRLAQAGESEYHTFCKSIIDQLHFVRSLQWEAGHRFEFEGHAGAGEHKKTAEARLLSELETAVAPLVGGTMLQAAGAAGKLAVALGVSGLPSTEKGLADRIRRHRQGVEIG